MKIIISPAKKMKETEQSVMPLTKPGFLDKTSMLLKHLKGLSYTELKTLLKCSDDIAALNYDRYMEMDLGKNLQPALLCYEGIQYRYMSPEVFTHECFDYVSNHLYILSGFYGLLRPFDGVTPYRLEMQAKVKTAFCKNLYDFWKDEPYQNLAKDTKVIVNLASGEYSKAVLPYLAQDIRWIDCKFGEKNGDKILEKGVYVKMARGEMVRFMAENNITDPEKMKSFNRLDFCYSLEDSSENEFVFIKQESKEQD